MDSAQASGDLLTRFDDFSNGIVLGHERSTRTRGVGWVLRWAAALAVLWLSACVLAEFAYSLGAEHTLARAAQAGALEATMPRATYRSVVETINRRIAMRDRWAAQLTISVDRNGAAVGGPIRAAGGDRMEVTIVVPARAVLPPWLSFLPFQTGESEIEVRAERDVPGRAF
jgi:hypothetical protein